MSRRQQIEKMLAAEPDDAFLNFGLAMELSKDQRWDEAVERFLRVQTIDPSYIPAYFQRGRTLLAAGRADDARAALEEGITAARRIGDDHAAAEMTELLQAIG